MFMSKKAQLLALLSFLSIPLILVAGGALFAAIDPERLSRHASYARDFWFFQHVKNGVFLAMLALCAVAWFLTCLIVIRAKHRSAWWLALALLGPPGFIVLVLLRDLAPGSLAAPAKDPGRLDVLRRILVEACVFVLLLAVADAMMETKREISIALEAARTGQSREQIAEQRDADGGMWAFSEGNEVLYFLVLLYLLRPLGARAARSLFKRRESTQAG
jgi:hypothetical protein